MKRILPLTLLVFVFYSVRRLNRLMAGVEASENEIFGDAAERMARWNEKLANLDSLN